MWVNVQPHVSGLQFVFLSRILDYRKLGLCDKCVGSVHIEKQLIESKHRELYNSNYYHLSNITTTWFCGA